MPTILLAYDGSDPARVALERTARLAPDAEVIVSSVAHGLATLGDAASAARVALSDETIRTAVSRLRDSELDEARELAEEGARRANALGLRARPLGLATEGSQSQALCAAADEAGADLVACGTHGRGMVARAIVGSVSTALARDAAHPVLVVPARSSDDDGPVVVGFDGSDASAAAIEACGRLLGGRPALIVHIWRARIGRTIGGKVLQHAPVREVSETFNELDEMFEAWARETAERGAGLAREHGLDATPLPVEAPSAPAHALLDVAEEHRACVIVAGRQGGRGPSRSGLGSVAAGLLHAAERPVLLA